MPALLPTDFSGDILWLGRVRDRGQALASQSADALQLSFDGPAGESHGGATRPSCARVSLQHPKGTEIRNVRQVSIVSAEELAQVAARMGLDRLDPAWVGASVVLTGLPNLSLLPPSSRLQAPDGTTLVVDMQNRPCHLPDPVIRAESGGSDPTSTFRAAAQNLRGVTAWVEREGTICRGETLRLHIPDQPVWPHLAEACSSAT